MAILETNINRQREVMVVSSDSGPPRLDLAISRSRRGTFSTFGSNDGRAISHRTARSSNDVFAQALSRIETTDSDSEWGIVRARARENNERQGLGDLIDFFRTTSPPPQLPERSVFDHDEEIPDQEEDEPERWNLFKKLRLPRTRARSESPARRPRTSGLPNSAVASKTARGNSHIAISIPLDYCHVGPDSDWALAIFNATPPLPPTPARAIEEITNGQTRPYASDRAVTVLKTVSESASASTLNTPSTKSPRQRKGAKGPMSIWPKIKPSPTDPPGTPYTTPPGTLRGKTSASKKHGRLAALPAQYAELPASPVIMPQSPDSNLDENFWESGLLSQPLNQRKPTTKPPKRPANITLPLRRSSIKIVRSKTVGASEKNQPSIDGVMDGYARRQSVTFDASQISPGYSEVPSLSPSIATTELSEPIISRARSGKAYSTASVILQNPDSTTPRQSLTIRPGSSDTAQTTLVNESVASRNPSTRTAASRQSRKDRVKSLKQRDMEALRALNYLQQKEDGETTPRPRTTETVISSLRLPSRDGTFGSRDDFRHIKTKLSATKLAYMAKSHNASPYNQSNGSSSKISDWQATQRVDTPGWETAQEEWTPGWETAREETPTPDWLRTTLLDETMAAADSAASKFDNSLSRNSSVSSEPPRRWGSYHRTSWASSVPLLDRIGSFAPSDADASKVVELVGDHTTPPRPTRMSRADSATLSLADSARLTSPRRSIVEADAHFPRSSTETTEQFIAGSIAAFPKPDSGPRLSAIMPVAEVVPTGPGPVDERWSASTLNSPLTVVPTSHHPFANTETSVQPRSQLTHPHTAGNTNTELFNTAQDIRHRSAFDDGDADETATLRPKRRSREDVIVDLLSMSATELRTHYASLRNARVNDLAHEMLLNQERLEMRMHQQEMNQMLFIERLERCMSELRSLPGSPYSMSRPLDWPLDDNGFVYEERRISRMRRTGHSHGSHHQQIQPGSSRSPRRLVESQDNFVDFDGDFVDGHNQRRQRRPSTSHNTSSSRRPGEARPRRHGAPILPSLLVTRRGGLDSLEPLIRELQHAARVSQETNRTEMIQTPQPGDPDDYYYNMI